MTDLALADLARYEAVIERGLNTFVEVGNALLAIRDERLYRADYATFEDYCRERWGFSDSRARQLIGAAQTVTNVTVAGLPAPTNEGQARELARVPEGQRADVWRETVERTGGKPTAAAVRETHAVRQAAALLLRHAGYDDPWIADRLDGAAPLADATGVTPELVDEAVAHLRAVGITYWGIDEAAEKLRADLQPAAPAPPTPEPSIWYGGPPADDPPPAPEPAPKLPVGQDRADAAAARVDRLVAEPEPWTEEERELQRQLADGETVVVSMRDGRHARLIAWAEQGGMYVRIDRRSPWGNPFEMGPDGDRATVIGNYENHYLPYKPSLLSRLPELRGKALGCWCAPEPCHGDVLKARAE